MNWNTDWTYEQHRQYVNENIEKAQKRRQVETLMRESKLLRRTNRRRRNAPIE
ncbi:hypothetical protein G4Y79_08980 [Phototrophicus methaneseepsis]|uniref:Uncharacterized protein n=1 Tax=Phototrophicus methaneseepsis TaxID=2710758 RepID=A0A7S8ECN2_9CHLR|nr:hypothetical protein [Phototrophicus methaneseepsis]QPC84491.1 hypothetical protein G4Y79_08980 [Phototrophicus methaneseepsis]